MPDFHIQEISHFAEDAHYSSSLLAVQHHMGLGDHIHLSGLVRYTVVELGFEEVLLFCKEVYYQTMTRLYADDERITVVSVGDIYGGLSETGLVRKHLESLGRSCVYLRLGFERYPGQLANKFGYPSFIFYDLACISRDVRWEYFKFSRNRREESRLYKKLNPKDVPYIFVHDDPSRGFNIPLERVLKASPFADDKLVIRNDMSENILDFGAILENSAEIHCMGSALFCLADMLSLEHPSCFYHNIRPVFSESEILHQDTRNEWSWVP